MKNGTTTGRGAAATLALAIALLAVALLLPAAALAITSSPPTVTIVQSTHTSLPTPAPTAAAPAVDYPNVWLYLNDEGWDATDVRFSNDAGATWSTSMTMPTPPYTTWSLWDGLDAATLLDVDGLRTVTAQFSNDHGATWGATASATTLVDTQIPVVVAPEGYWNNRHPYALSASDQVGLSGVFQLAYRVDAGPVTVLTNAGPLGTTLELKTTFPLAGGTGTPHTITYLAVDYAGNPSSGRIVALGKRSLLNGGFDYVVGGAQNAYVVIDRKRPKARVRGVDERWHKGPVSVSFSAVDRGGAGVAFIQYCVTTANAKKPGSWTIGDSVVISQSGRSKVWYRATDNALPRGNTSVLKSVLVKIRPQTTP